MIDLETCVPAWAKQSLLQRLLGCRLFLLGHGMLSDAEAEKVLQRIKREVEKRNSKRRVSFPTTE